MAIELDPKFSKAYARRARCQAALSQFEAAIADFNKAMEFDPNDRDLAKELRATEQSMLKEKEREKDLYYVLGVSKNATERDLKLAYHKLSLVWHPDKAAGKTEAEIEASERKFKVISDAYQILKDPAKRQEYDFKQSVSNLNTRAFGSFAESSLMSVSERESTHISEIFGKEESPLRMKSGF